MGKYKEQPFKVFVKDEFNRRKRAGEQNVIFENLFHDKDLSERWKSLPQEKRQKYKDRAAGINSGGHFNGSAFQPARPHQTQSSEQQREPKPSTSNFHSASNNCDVKMNSSFNGDTKHHVDVKPVIKEERGLKREHELDSYTDFREQQENEQARKRGNFGFGLDGKKFADVKDSAKADRYFDKHLLELRNSCETIVSSRARSLLTKPLYTFSCNVLCKYKKDQEVKYVPIEFGIHAFTLGEGALGKPYHVIIDSGAPPQNYWNDSFDHMNSTHKIQVTRDGTYPPEARTDYAAIYKQMLKYVRAGERTILVADNYDLDQVKKSIEWIYEAASSQNLDCDAQTSLAKPTTWTILPLVDFVAAIYNHVYCKMLKYPIPKFTLHYYLKVRLETSIWDYDVDLMCKYHRQEQYQTKWCARNCARRVHNALLLTFEEIYKNYKLAEDPEAEKRKEAESYQQQDVPSSTSSSTTNQERIPAQQVQQPLHMPEEKVPPPLFEQVARRQEILRQQQEALLHPPPPPGDYDYNEPPPSHGINDGPPLAIEPAPHTMNMLDPRVRRQADVETHNVNGNEKETTQNGNETTK